MFLPTSSRNTPNRYTCPPSPRYQGTVSGACPIRSFHHRAGGPHTKEGVILFGSAWDMRHPLTGGGMFVAPEDVVLLAPMIAAEPDPSTAIRSRTFSTGGTGRASPRGDDQHLETSCYMTSLARTVGTACPVRARWVGSRWWEKAAVSRYAVWGKDDEEDI